MGSKFSKNESYKNKILDLFLSFQKTGLYQNESITDEIDFQQFIKFCDKLENRLIDSPRNIILKELTKKSNKLFDSEPEVRELYRIIGLNEKVNFIILLKYFDTLDFGKLYSKFLILKNKSKYRKMNYQEKVLAINNKKQKMIFRNENINNFNFNNFIGEIESKKKNKCKKIIEELKEIKIKLLTDKNYKNYQKAKFLWDKYKFSNMKKKFNEIDFSIGEDRRLRGNKFEKSKSLDSFKFIRNDFIKKNKKLNKYLFNFFTNCIWIGKNKNKIGEIDLVVTYNKKPIAIAEFKSNCFDIPRGYFQHYYKVKNNNFLQLERNNIVKVNSDIKIYLITLIPDNKSIAATDSKLIKMIGDSLTDMGKYNTNKYHQNFTLTDFLEFRKKVRNKLNFEISPDKFLKKYWQNIIVFKKL